MTDVWLERSLGEMLARIEGGGTPSKRKPMYWGGAIPWASVKDLPEGAYRLCTTESTITEIGLRESASNLVPRGTVILATRIGLGRVARADIDVAINQDLKALYPSDDLDTQFLLWLLAYHAPLLEHIGTGTTVKGIRLDALRSLQVRVPSLPTQRKIAAILGAFDDLIENNLRRIEILEEMARLIYEEWFVHYRFPGHEDVPMVDSALGEIPQGWEVASYADIARFVNGYAFGPAHWGEEGLPIIKIRELKEGITDDTPRYHGEDIAPKYFVDTGDILFSWSAHLDVYLWRNGRGLLNQHLFRVVPRKRISKDWLFHSLSQAMPRFRSLSMGTTMRHIKRSALDRVRSAKPPWVIQRAFAERVGPMHHLAANLQQQVDWLRQARDLLLAPLVSGEIDVSEMEMIMLEENGS